MIFRMDSDFDLWLSFSVLWGRNEDDLVGLHGDLGRFGKSRDVLARSNGIKMIHGWDGSNFSEMGKRCQRSYSRKGEEAPGKQKEIEINYSFTIRKHNRRDDSPKSADSSKHNLSGNQFRLSIVDLVSLGKIADILRVLIEDLTGLNGKNVNEREQYKITLGHCENSPFFVRKFSFGLLCSVFLCACVLDSFNTVLCFCFLVQDSKMAQGSLVGGGGSNAGDKKQGSHLKITVPRFDNTALIRGYSRTLIGRCMNPAAQDVNALLHHMSRFWKMEDRVAGADLGMGRFQFDFDNEEDIVEVFKLEPFHFDYWMVSLVRWEPVMDPTYPSAIKFWVRMMGIPLHFWAEPTFRSIGEALGEVLEVDIDVGRVKVCLDGYKPLIFETTVEFHGGEENLVALRYERLFGFCRKCSSLCHDVSQCPVLRRVREERDNHRRRDEKPDGGVMSYKSVVVNRPGGEQGNVRQAHPTTGGDVKGKGKVEEAREERGKRQATFRGKNGGESSGSQRKLAGFVPLEQRKRINRPTVRLKHMAAPATGLVVIDMKGNDPSPSQQSVNEEAGTKLAHTVNEEMADGTGPVNEPTVNESVIPEEGEDGEIWWNEVLDEGAAEEAAEEAADEDENHMETQDSNDMLMEVSDNAGNAQDVEQFVDVCMVHGAKTPRKKTASKEPQRLGEKQAGKAKEAEKNLSEGSGTNLKAP
ncbi:unnamed protein product [Microthlaspi erraticum]|uniref:DUF4283 domain-containing protein n=1 Tax=Microthlaspi erraticum TaxID=1685480 RepID=A0A6D2KYU2_9BRAS|nr:unnamed protein product [Microthlaspi erraticum]